MSGSVNKVILLGNLGRDPEVRHLESGNKVVNLSIATSESWKDKNSGERREKTEWHRVVIWDERLADVAERYLAKGRPVYLEGALRTRKWVDQSGQERYSTEVVLERYRGELTLLGGRGSDGGDDATPGEQRAEQNRAAQQGAEQNRAAQQGAAASTSQGSLDDLDDEIPF